VALKVILEDGEEYLITKLSLEELKEKIEKGGFEGQLYERLFALIRDNNDLLKKSKPDVSKNSAGYYLWNVWDGQFFDLPKLIVGSQGTLGLVTEITFRLIKKHNHSRLLVVFTGGSVSTLELWVNNIFVNPEVHDIFIKRIGFSLIRVHREHVQQVTQSSGRVLLSNLKWPIECMFVGFRRTFYETNATTSAANNQMWHRFAHPSATATAKFHGVSSVSGGAFAAVPPSITITTWHRICASLTISAHGVPLYNVAPGMMLDSYIPYRFSSTGVSTDKDGLGAMMVNFCLFPGAYQPSGHINVSRAREFYLEYVSAYDEGGSTYIIGTGGAIQTGAATCTLVVIASAINFLLISDGSAVLRYTT
jgi:hypothetical protein